jgi:tRNA-uridine 2-sulfurtransferase
MKVLIAMSGGIDSAVAAILLKEKNFDCIGIHFKFWSLNNKCCSLESEYRARKICAKLNIPFYVFNLEKEFKQQIINPFLKTISQNKTPNPCVWCNRKIKFRTLHKYRRLLKADLVATGHYARVKNNLLYKAKDKNKDQSYFLWQVKDFEKTIFPLGQINKEQVKRIAQENKLCFEKIKESQEICFVDNKIEDFFKKHLKDKPGDIVYKNEKIGRHNGLFYYTIGQRKGINLSGGPFYVLNKDNKKNILFVTKKEKELEQKEIKMKNVKWFVKNPFPFKCKARIRYKSPLKQVLVNDKKVFFIKPSKAVTPGQSIVFYNKEQVLGGGIIL